MGATERPLILIIDDEADVREMIEFGLSIRGYDVLQAPNGEGGLAVARNHCVDVVLCDLKMPGMGGIATIQALRAEFPDVPVVVATGLLSPETEATCLACGAIGYIRKPFSLSDLQTMIENARAWNRR